MKDPGSTKSLVQIIIEKCNKVYYSITENFIYLIMAFAAPLFLYYISQGKEVVLYLLDPDEWMNIAMILVSFIVLFYVIWVIPVWSIELLKILSDRNMMTRKMEKEEGGVSPPQLFCILANRYNSDFNNKTVYPIRIFANIPVLVFVFTIAGTQWDELFSPFIFLTFLLISLVIKDLVKEFVVLKILKEYIVQQPYLGYFGHGIIIIMASLLWACGWYLCSAFVIWLLYFYNDWFHCFIERISEYWKEIPEIKSCTSKDKRECLYRKSKNVFSVYVLIILVFILTFIFAERTGYMYQISPVLIMNICFSFIICLIDTAFKTPKDALEVLVVMDQVPDDHSNCLKEIPNSESLLEKTNEKKGKEDPSNQGNIDKGLYLFFSFANIVFLLVSLNLIFIKSLNNHRIRKERIGKELYDQLGNRDSLMQYYEIWKERNDNPRTVVLIAGSGGGSRAGYWSGINLDYIYSNLYSTEKIFAISTISGSTSGANMFLTRIANDPKNLTVKEIKSFWDTIYSRNYLSGGIWGVLLGDGIGGVSMGKTDYDKDRNYYHEQGELSALQSYYPSSEHDQIRKLMLGDYMTKWYDSATLKYKVPLHFINTATTQAGKRVVVSPVVVDSTTHPDVVDLYKEFRMNTQTSCNQFSLPMTTAVKISQSFPVVSSYYYLKGVGNLIDGGLYESSGCNTLYEVYTKLREIEKDTNVHFKIMVILNGDSDNCNTEPVNSMLLNTLGSASATPFSGHSVYWQEKMKTLDGKNKTTVKFVELKDSLGNWKEFPLGVMYSQSSLNQIWEYYKEK